MTKTITFTDILPKKLSTACDKVFGAIRAGVFLDVEILNRWRASHGVLGLPCLEGVESWAYFKFQTAAIAKDEGTFGRLIRIGAHEYARSGFDGTNALHAATLGHYIRGIRKLVGRGGLDIDTTDSDRRTPLHLAADLGRYRIARLLLDSGANVDARTSDGRTPLMLAAECDSKLGLRLITLLVKRGADLKAVARNGQTARDRALARNCQAGAELLECLGG